MSREVMPGRGAASGTLDPVWPLQGWGVGGAGGRGVEAQKLAPCKSPLPGGF